ncbi:hypothetical protein SAMN05518672_11376 [Chitinophaga sp. CF118]|uniref:hypothetical protein n=1 Tax=Chitinophaga sp. CF118 TaxID=1884367 RepID=UPI0008E001C4|nr:hypothetical protein [Chitinophaga sp. CF118]SFE96806.1 hypothetical protein SAMN05518672_11376 [Chitinophaga sp. CF118]
MEPSKISSTSFFHHTHLNEQELKHPELAINRFCELFPLTDVRQALWLWLNETLTAQDTHYEDTQNRANLLVIYNQLLYLLDATYIMNHQYTSAQQMVKVNEVVTSLASYQKNRYNVDESIQKVVQTGSI